MSNLIDRLAKIMPQLTSDDDIAICNAVRAMQRILKSEGKSFHDMPDLMRAGGSSSRSSHDESHTYSSAGTGYSSENYSGGFGGGRSYTNPYAEQIKKADFIRKATNMPFTDWEKDFWADIQERISTRELSVRQMAIIDRLYERAQVWAAKAPS